MKRKLKDKLSYANVVSTLCLFLLLRIHAEKVGLQARHGNLAQCVLLTCEHRHHLNKVMQANDAYHASLPGSR